MNFLESEFVPRFWYTQKSNKKTGICLIEVTVFLWTIFFCPHISKQVSICMIFFSIYVTFMSNRWCKILTFEVMCSRQCPFFLLKFWFLLPLFSRIVIPFIRWFCSLFITMVKICCHFPCFWCQIESNTGCQIFLPEMFFARI